MEQPKEQPEEYTLTTHEIEVIRNANSKIAQAVSERTGAILAIIRLRELLGKWDLNVDTFKLRRIE